MADLHAHKHFPKGGEHGSLAPTFKNPGLPTATEQNEPSVSDDDFSDFLKGLGVGTVEQKVHHREGNEGE